MKRIWKSFIVLTLIVTVSLNLQAQQTWEWSSYKVAMDLPDDFEVVKNTDNECE